MPAWGAAGQQGTNPQCHAAPCRHITVSGQGMPRTFKKKKKKKKAGCKGLLQRYWSEKAERASLPSVHASPPLQLFITSHSGKDNLLKILQRGSRRPSLECWLPLVPSREGLPGGCSSPGQAPRGHSARSALLVVLPVVLVFCFHSPFHPLPYVHCGSRFLYYVYWSSQPARAEMWDRFNKNNRFSGSLEW